FKNFCYCL
uniref:Uncharacterized protein n=1 Tax=Strongyloides papillosus TaxID=174720 RepID=A0A0N5C9G8_STREA